MAVDREGRSFNPRLFFNSGLYAVLQPVSARFLRRELVPAGEAVLSFQKIGSGTETLRSVSRSSHRRSNVTSRTAKCPCADQGDTLSIIHCTTKARGLLWMQATLDAARTSDECMLSAVPARRWNGCCRLKRLRPKSKQQNGRGCGRKWQACCASDLLQRGAARCFAKCR